MKTNKFLVLVLFFAGILGGVMLASKHEPRLHSGIEASLGPVATTTTSTSTVASSTSSIASSTIGTATSSKDAALLEKIDQLFIIGFRGMTYESSPELKRALSSTNLGGVILFDYDSPSKKYARNIQTESQVKKLIADIKAHASTSPFIAIDEEGGKVSRLKTMPTYTKTPSAFALGTKPDAEVQQEATGLATELVKLGFNIDFAPVLDVAVNASNPVIAQVERAFAADPNVVTEKGLAFYKGLASQGIIAAVKHFPGHGSSNADTHAGFVDITSTYKQYELEPFTAACKAGVPMVMVGHLYNKNVDSVYPTTLSKAHMEVLKHDAGCVDQVIVSDDLDMGAITKLYGKKEALTRALNAGVDIIILSNNINSYNPQEFFSARQIVLDQVKAGAISAERIEEAYTKVQKLKRQYLR